MNPWVILTLFAVYSASNAFQWLEFTIAKDSIVKFYNVSDDSLFTVEYTGTIYMLSYMILVFPATKLISLITVRQTVLLGSGISCVGSLVKCIGGQNWTVVCLGQTMVACAQSLILEIPPMISYQYFEANQRNIATSIGVFGNQLGVALGFLLPNIIISSYGLIWLNISVGVVCAIIFILQIYLFENPKKKSSLQHPLNSQSSTPRILETKHAVLPLFKNSSFLLLFCSYGIITGTYYAFSIIIASFLPGVPAETVGSYGFVMVVCGMAGSVVCGVILDKCQKYKLVTFLVYLFSLLCLILFFAFSMTNTNSTSSSNLEKNSSTLSSQSSVAATTTSTPSASYMFGMGALCGVLGFFMTGYLPIGFEFAAEMTFPVAEATSAGVLNFAAQAFGYGMTWVSLQLAKGDDHWSCTKNQIFLVGGMCIGLVLTIFIKAETKRRDTEREVEEQKLEAVESDEHIADDVFDCQTVEN